MAGSLIVRKPSDPGGNGSCLTVPQKIRRTTIRVAESWKGGHASVFRSGVTHGELGRRRRRFPSVHREVLLTTNEPAVGSVTSNPGTWRLSTGWSTVCPAPRPPLLILY